MTRRSTIALVASALTICSGTALADLQYEVAAGIGESNNITRVSDGEIDQTIGLLGLDLTWITNGPRLTADGVVKELVKIVIDRAGPPVHRRFRRDKFLGALANPVIRRGNSRCRCLRLRLDLFLRLSFQLNFRLKVRRPTLRQSSWRSPARR